MPYIQPSIQLIHELSPYSIRIQREKEKLKEEGKIATSSSAEAEGILEFTRFDATKIMKKCGYQSNGTFNSDIALDQPLKSLGFNV